MFNLLNNSKYSLAKIYKKSREHISTSYVIDIEDSGNSGNDTKKEYFTCFDSLKGRRVTLKLITFA